MLGNATRETSVAPLNVHTGALPDFANSPRKVEVSPPTFDTLTNAINREQPSCVETDEFGQDGVLHLEQREKKADVLVGLDSRLGETSLVNL